MNRVKLLQNPLPIDRVAKRVVRKAKAEELWRPMPKEVTTRPPIDAVLKTAPVPPKTGASWLYELAGKRRGRMVILGYAADQAKNNKGARWVVRCDCGNFEHRTRIGRWLSTEADDMCRECQMRRYKLRGPASDKEPAKRGTAV